MCFKGSAWGTQESAAPGAPRRQNSTINLLGRRLVLLLWLTLGLGLGLVMLMVLGLVMLMVLGLV